MQIICKIPNINLFIGTRGRLLFISTFGQQKQCNKEEEKQLFMLFIKRALLKSRI
jgi:hypothetical protein